jgi:hypothetical protein
MLMHARALRSGERFYIAHKATIPDPCTVCGAESRTNACERCQKAHWHGRIHDAEGHLQARCKAHHR